MQTLTRSKFQHVIARSAATWQSVLLAVQHHRKQYFGRIRKMLRIRPSSTSLHTQAPGKSLHVIARSAATWQSVLLAVQHRRKQYLRRIRSRLQIRPKAHLSLPFPAGTRIATPVCALVRNDMQKTGTRQRMQGGGTRGKVRRRWQFCLVQRPCLCGHTACFCMSLRGAQRRGNPFSLQYSIAESSTSGEYAAVYKFAQKRIYRCLSLRGRGLPHLVAPKSAMPCSGQRPEQGNAPLGLLSPQSVPLCGVPWLCRPKASGGATLPWCSSPRKGAPFAGPPCTGSQ